MRRESTRRTVGDALFLVLLSLAATFPATAQPQPRNPRPGRTEAKGFPAKQVIEADLSAVEDELAGLMQFRGAMPDEAQAARLELLIDLRVTARWLLLAAAAAPAESDLQACCFLRAEELRGTAKTLTDLFRERPPPTAAQSESMRKLHALTFRLPELKSVKQADDACREIGAQLSVAGGPFPPDVKAIPLMRPAVPAGSGATKPVGPASRAVVVDPLSRANLVTVAAPLKRQLVALAQAAAAAPSAAEPDQDRRKELAAVEATLLRVLDMAEALARGTAVDAAARPKVEQQLADAVALYVDPRVRGVGQRRLSDLDAFAGAVARVRRLNLKPELQQKLAPTLSWAANNAEQGPRAMAAVEAYLAAAARLDAKYAGGVERQPLPVREAKVQSEALRLAGLARDQFLGDASRATPDVTALGADVAAMNQNLDLADLIERLPKAQATVLAYKPKPTGGLERRLALATLVLSEPKAGPGGMTRDEALKLLAEMAKLADLAADVEAPAAPVPADVARLYAKNQIPAFDARRRDIVAELAGHLAAGKEMDSQRILRLQNMKQVRAALAEAAVMEAAAARLPVAARWVDWAVPPEEAQALLAPYREGLSGVVEAYAADNPSPPSWAAVRDRNAPLVRLMLRIGPPAEACAVLPGGLAGHIGRLMTPMDAQPFAAERFAAFCVRLWARFEQAGDADAARHVAEAMGKRI